MDPFAAIEKLIDAIADGNYEESQDILADLISWEDRGGFVPRLAEIVNHRTV